MYPPRKKSELGLFATLNAISSCHFANGTAAQQDHQALMSTARVSSRKYFIPGCVGKGLDLGLRIRPAAAPAAAPAASGNPGLGPLGIEVEKQGFRTAWLITGQKFP